MPFLRKNRREIAKREINRKERLSNDIDLSYIIRFIRHLCSMSFGIFTLTLLGYILAFNTESRVIYEFTLAVNAIIIIGSLIMIKVLTSKYNKYFKEES